MIAWAPESPADVGTASGAYRDSPGITREPAIFLALQTEWDATRGMVETADVERKAARITEPMGMAAGHGDGGVLIGNQQAAGGAFERASIVFEWVKRVTGLCFPVLLVARVESVFSRNV